MVPRWPRRAAFLPSLLVAAIVLGAYQTGYVARQCERLKARAAAAGRTPRQEAYAREGAWGYLRAHFRTNFDERLYLEYARLVLHGRADVALVAAKQNRVAAPPPRGSGRLLPYEDVPVEYPPVTLAAVTLPGLVSLDPWGYRFALGALNLVALLVTLALARTLAAEPADPRRGVLRLALFCAAIGVVVATRIDLVATALCLGAVVACERRRPALGGVLTGAGIMAKLFPALLVPIVCLIYLRRRDGRALVAFAGAVVTSTLAILAGAAALFGPGVLDVFGYHLDRGIQLESSWASLLMLLHHAAGVPVEHVRSFGSSNLSSPLAPLLLALSPLLLLGLAAPFLWSAWRGGARAGTLLAGVLLALLLSSKVLSPQYLLWVSPLFVAERASARRWIGFLGACVLTQLIWPYGYEDLQALAPAAELALLLRNALLAFLWWDLAREALGYSASRVPAVAPAAPRAAA